MRWQNNYTMLNLTFFPVLLWLASSRIMFSHIMRSHKNYSGPSLAKNIKLKTCYSWIERLPRRTEGIQKPQSWRKRSLDPGSHERITLRRFISTTSVFGIETKSSAGMPVQFRHALLEYSSVYLIKSTFAGAHASHCWLVLLLSVIKVHCLLVFWSIN